MMLILFVFMNFKIIVMNCHKVNTNYVKLEVTKVISASN